MKKIADVTDNWGSWVRVDIIPGTDLDDPELIVVTIKDEATAAVTLTRDQVRALYEGLEDALWVTD